MGKGVKVCSSAIKVERVQQYCNGSIELKGQEGYEVNLNFGSARNLILGKAESLLTSILPFRLLLKFKSQSIKTKEKSYTYIRLI